MKYELISCINSAYNDTLFFARMIQSYSHLDMCVRPEIKTHIVSVLEKKSGEDDLNFDKGVYTDLKTFVEVLGDALRETVPVISIGTRRGDVLIANTLNAWMPETVADGPNVLRMKLFDLALYYARQLEIQTEQANHNLQDVFEICNYRSDSRMILEVAEEIAPGVNAGIYLKGEADRDIMNTPWMLFFYQLVLQYKV